MSKTTQHGFVAMYNDKREEIYADSLYQAKCKAIEIWKVPKSKQGLVAIMLAERPDGSTVIHTPTF